MNNISCDVIVGLQHGDEGKGKVTYHLLKDNQYDYTIRYNGGPNAGHTIYHNDEKIVLHQLPCGILLDMTCIIGSGCVVDIEKLEEEIKMVEAANIANVRQNLKIAYNAHVITPENIELDKQNNIIGTTSSGIGPTYSNKYNRTGKRICDVRHLINDWNIELIHPIEYFFNISKKANHKTTNDTNNDTNDETNKKVTILFEGAQGFELDIDWGDYPFVTSSNCLSGNCFTSGIPPSTLNNVYGVGKIYETYVGNKVFENNHSTQPHHTELFEKIRELGGEYGSTTGRKRQCNWLNIDRLIASIICNGVQTLILNKCDIIKQLGIYKLIFKSEILNFTSFHQMKEFIVETLSKTYKFNIEIIFSESKDKI